MWLGCLNVEICDEVICFEFSFGFQLNHWCAIFLSLVSFFVLDWLILESYARTRACIFSVFKVVKLEWRFFCFAVVVSFFLGIGFLVNMMVLLFACVVVLLVYLLC